MPTTHRDALVNAGVLALVMPVVPTSDTFSKSRALTVVLRAAAGPDFVADDLSATRRERELEAAADVLTGWWPTRIAVDAGLSGCASRDAMQLASMVAARFGHRRLWNATLSRDLDAPGLFRQRASSRFGARLAADWYAQHIILFTDAAACTDADDRLLVVTATGDGPLMRDLLAPTAQLRRTAPRRALAGAA
jgi:hypothetical protein